jgi:hypothetical protein
MTFLTSIARNKELAIHQLASAVVVHIARGQFLPGLKTYLLMKKVNPMEKFLRKAGLHYSLSERRVGPKPSAIKRPPSRYLYQQVSKPLNPATL